MVAERSARQERTQAGGQALALIVTGPEELRARFAGRTPAALAAAIAALRPRPGDVPGYATRVALRELGRRVQFPGARLDRLGELIGPLVTARAPGLLSLYGVGPDTAALPSPPGITRSGCAARARGRTCAAPPRSPLLPARPLAGTGSTAAATARRTTRCGGS